MTSLTELAPERSANGVDAEPAQSVPSVPRLIQKLDALAPAIEAESETNERLGRLSERTLELLREAEIPLLTMPKALGGLGMFLAEAMHVIDRLAQIDASAGWIGGNWSASGFLLSFFSPEGVRKLLEKDPLPYFAVSGAMTGKAIPTEGGYRLTGQWPFGSGCLHAAWVLVGALTCDAEGQPLPGEGGMPAHATYGAPAELIKNLGNWDTLGLSGTGSVDYGLTDIFVPDDLVIDILKPALRDDLQMSGGFLVCLAYLHTSFAMGAARRVLDEIIAHAQRPSSRGGGLAQSPLFRAELGRQEVAVRAARAFVYEVWAQIDRKQKTGQPIVRRDYTLLRATTLGMHSTLREAAQFAFARGTQGALRAGRLQRWVRDALAACQHFMANEDNYLDVAWELMGAPEDLVWSPLGGLIPTPGK